ncbi:MAG TPA: hypothetical protein VLJ88_11690, partial [Propionibacteriaceae bacterium]|nr:hypothetical protein [Propionibacteriaceae bacterium]
LADTYTDEQLALLHDLIRDFRVIVTKYAAELRDRATNHNSPPSTATDRDNAAKDDRATEPGNAPLNQAPPA